MKKQEIDYIESLAFANGYILTLISKGKAWIEVDKKRIKITGTNHKAVKYAGLIQMMFNTAVEKKTMDIEKIQKALDYFKWDIKLVKEDKSVFFKGSDRFLVVQIGHLMGGINSKQYAEIYRNAVKHGEKIYF